MARNCVVPGCTGCKYCRWEEQFVAKVEVRQEEHGAAWAEVLKLADTMTTQAEVEGDS